MLMGMAYDLGAFHAQESTGTLYEVVGLDGGQVMLENVATLRTTSHSAGWCDRNLKFMRAPRSEGEALTDADLAMAEEWGSLSETKS